MRYSVNNYVDAFSQAIQKMPHEEAVGGFVKLLKKTGDIRHAGKIVEAIDKKLIKQKGGHWVNIESARELPKTGRQSLINKFSGKDHIDFKINPELVAGVRITVDGEEEMDNSLNNKLNKLFK